MNTVSMSIKSALASLDSAVELGAVVDRDDEAVLTRATELDAAVDQETPLGALHGRAITVKDWIDALGFACEGESPERTGRQPRHDATAVARLREAGAVIVAKTQPGGDHPSHGRCHHPIDPDRTPGGTSSGEAALIGRGASNLGLGSDSGGSIRLPSAWCGVVGFKPSYGLVPTTGHFPRVGYREDGRTVIGPMAATVADVEAALRVIAGPDGIDPSCAPLPIGDSNAVSMHGLRVAVVEPDDRWPIASSTADAVERARSALVNHGAVEAISPTVDLSESLDISQRYWRRASLSGLECDQQLRDWDRFSSRVTRTAADVDIVIGPVVADIAPLHRDLVGEDYIFTLPWSLTGWPAISLPLGADAETGLPVAVQIAAPRWHDHVVLAVAAALEVLDA